MILERQDRLILAAAVLATVASAGWFGGGAVQNEAKRYASAPVAIDRVAEPPRLPSNSTEVELEKTWSRPSTQSTGAGWVYEIFTPPEIGREARSGRFVLGMPIERRREESAVDSGDEGFGLTLLTVARAPFRLQLVGHAGSADRRAGIFEDQLTGQTLLARAGQRVGELDYAVEQIAIERLALSTDHPRTLRPVARAVIRNTRGGEIVVLNDQWPTLTDAAVATVSLAADGGAVHTVRPGEELVRGDVVFQIGKIQLAPPTLEATKVSSRSRTSESRVLLVPTTEFASVAQPTL